MYKDYYHILMQKHIKSIHIFIKRLLQRAELVVQNQTYKTYLAEQNLENK